MQPAVLGNVVHRLEVAIGKVNHVNVVAYTGAVHSGVVVAEHVQVLAAAHRHLGNKRHQVIRNS